MKRFGLVVMLSALTALAALATAPVTSAQPGDKCGGKGQAPCPLQGWMEKEVQGPFEAKDYKKLAAALEKAAKFAPDPAWNKGATSWEKLAKESAKAASGGDLKTIKKTCKACHKAWRKKYKASHRMRKVPG
ncbi:MAG: hypothetical protein OXU20_32665 [Myxococcales bacterium]|nr:hypothetical protein [Myxococcales bacterium]MDD9968414.1 hypothetical protein [Myxococcales bacterium]